MAELIPDQSGYLALHRLSIHLVLASDICFLSKLYIGILPDFTQRVLLLTLTVIAFMYWVIALLRGHLLAASLGALAVAIVFGQIIVFEANWDMAPNWSGAGQYAVFLSFLPIFIMARDGQAGHVTKLLALYSFAYAAIYIGWATAYQAGIVPRQFVSSILLSDTERGDRLFAYLGALSYAWYVALGRVRADPSAWSFSALLVCATANILTLSRVYLTCLGVVTILNLIGASTRTIRFICLGTMLGVGSVISYGLVDSRWNPFLLTSADSSGLGRALEFQVSQELYANSPVLGLGLASTPDYPPLISGISFFSPGDFGVAGVLLDFGILGIVLFLVSSAVSCAPIVITGDANQRILFLNGCTFVLYGCIAPVLFSPGGIFYFAANLGLWLAQTSRSQARPSRPPAMAACERLPASQASG
jgi:hypothetical protein